MVTKYLTLFCIICVLIATSEVRAKKEGAISPQPIEAEFSPEFVKYYNRGLKLIRNENYLSAVAAFKKAIQIDPSVKKLTMRSEQFI